MHAPTDFLTAKQAAARLRKSVRWLADLRAKRQGPPFYKIGRRVEYKVVDLDTWQERCRREFGRL